jgi:hypothetical protein
MRRFVVVIGASLLALAACGEDTNDASPPTTPSVGEGTTSPTPTAAASSSPMATASTEPATTGGADDGVLEVPAEHDTIQSAVDAASPGDLVLISPGTYHEAVNVTTDEITIRGLDRAGVVLDGEFELDNGIRVLGASGVAVENLTTQNYTTNGVFWTGVTGYRGSYLTAVRNGDYGIYAFDSTKGQIEHTYASGSPDAGFYIGQCYPCDAVIDDVISEHNGLGYSGTNAGGNLLIVNSTFRSNRAGIVPNSGAYELCYPERETTIVGNLVHSNNQPDTPAIDVAVLAMGNGILPSGGVRNVIERNRVWDHAKTGIGLVPFLEESPADDIPSPENWDRSCAEAKNDPPATEIPATILWQPAENRVVGNVVSDSGQGDIAIGSVDADLATLGNCFADNEFTSSAPTDLETLAPCEGEGRGDWSSGALNVVQWLADAENAPPPVDYEEADLPPPPELESMPDAATAPAGPATDVPFVVDVDAIVVPPAPSE